MRAFWYTLPVLRRAWSSPLAALLVTAVLVALAAVGASCTRSNGPRVRVVLITLDTLRYDSYAGSAERPSSMPLTRAWAAKGLDFEQFYAATSTTQPSHATMFTALQPWQHGMTRNGQILDAKLVTVAKRLKGAGFTTAAVVASVPLNSQFGFAQGFDVYKEHFDHGEGSLMWEGITIQLSHFYALADTVTNTAIDVINHAAGERQFFWFHYFDPHAPYGDTLGGETLNPMSVLDTAAQGPAAVADAVRRARELYNADVGFLDRGLDRLLRRLQDDSRTVETHIVVVSDHGECLGENGMMGHGQHLTEELIHVPLFINSPRVTTGVRRDTVGSIDIAPTLLSLAGVHETLPGGHDLTGPPDPSRWSLGMRRTYVTPWTDRRLDGSTRVLEPHLFYVATDGVIYTGNSAGLIGPEAQIPRLDAVVAKQMTDLFRSFEGELSGLAVQEALDPKTQHALEALGYVR